MSYLLSERHFRRYEDYIQRIVDTFPVPVVFDVVPPITQSDVLARNIRYAARSLMDNQWVTKVCLPKFFQMWEDVVISTTLNLGKVTCGPELTFPHKNLLQQKDTANLMQILPTVSLDNPAEDLIRAVVVLHHHRYLTEPSIITTPNAALMGELATKYDVAVQHENNVYTIL